MLVQNNVHVLSLILKWTWYLQLLGPAQQRQQPATDQSQSISWVTIIYCDTTPPPHCWLHSAPHSSMLFMLHFNIGLNSLNILAFCGWRPLQHATLPAVMEEPGKYGRISMNLVWLNFWWYIWWVDTFFVFTIENWKRGMNGICSASFYFTIVFSK